MEISILNTGKNVIRLMVATEKFIVGFFKFVLLNILVRLGLHLSCIRI